VAKRYRRRYARLDRRGASRAAKHDAALRSLEERESAIGAEEPIWRRRLSETERELERFENIRFPRFVLAVLWPPSGWAG
jgi:hypothetical protein